MTSGSSRPPSPVQGREIPCGSGEGVRHRSAGSSLPRWIAASVFFGLFFGGGLAGSQVARLVAPGSGVAELVSFLALPAGFVTGLVG